MLIHFVVDALKQNHFAAPWWSSIAAESSLLDALGGVE